jgi:hypothetical protein
MGSALSDSAFFRLPRLSSQPYHTIRIPPQDLRHHAMLLPSHPSVFADDGKHAQQLDEHDQLQPESSLKPGDKLEDSLNVMRGAIRTSSPDSAIDNSDTIRLGRNPHYLPPQDARRHVSHSPAPPRTIYGRLQLFWVKNKGLAFVLVAQLFGTLMNVTTRMLEMEGNDGK